MYQFHFFAESVFIGRSLYSLEEQVRTEHVPHLRAVRVAINAMVSVSYGCVYIVGGYVFPCGVGNNYCDHPRLRIVMPTLQNGGWRRSPELRNEDKQEREKQQRHYLAHRPLPCEDPVANFPKPSVVSVAKFLVVR